MTEFSANSCGTDSMAVGFNNGLQHNRSKAALPTKHSVACPICFIQPSQFSPILPARLCECTLLIFSSTCNRSVWNSYEVSSELHYWQDNLVVGKKFKCHLASSGSKNSWQLGIANELVWHQNRQFIELTDFVKNAIQANPQIWIIAHQWDK